MHISNCPRCHDAIRVPTGNFLPRARARCPWCSEEFDLQEVLDRLPPELTILSESDPESNTAANAALVPDEGFLADGGFEIDSSSETDAFELSGGQTALGDPVTLVEDPALTVIDPADPADTRVDGSVNLVTSAPNIESKRRKKSGGGLRSAIGVIFGGLLALPIAAGILWGFGLGPFADNGRPIAGVLPTSGSLESSDPGPPLAETEVGTVVSSDFANEGDDEPQATNQINGQNNDQVVDPADDQADDQAEPDLRLPEPDAVEVEKPSVDETELVLPEIESPAVEVASPVVSAQDSSDELAELVDRASQMITAIGKQNPQGEKRRHWLTTAYRTIAKASELSQPGDPSLARLAELVRDSQILDELDSAASHWLDAKSRTSDGLLVVGVSDGKTITLGSGKQVAVTGPVVLPSSGRAMAFGTISGDESMKATLVESL